MKLRSIVSLCFAILIAGCASPIIKVDVSNLEESSSVRTIDLRPPSEKENKLFSLLITSEAYGISRFGEERMIPIPLRLLQHRVYEKFSNESTSLELKVHHFVTYLNMKSELRGFAMGSAIGGAVGGSIMAGTAKYGVNGIAEIITEEDFIAEEEEYKRGLYTEEENPEKVSVFIVYLDAEINGKRVFVKTMTPGSLSKEMDEQPYVAAIQTAISYFLDQY